MSELMVEMRFHVPLAILLLLVLLAAAAWGRDDDQQPLRSIARSTLLAFAFWLFGTPNSSTYMMFLFPFGVMVAAIWLSAVEGSRLRPWMVQVPFALVGLVALVPMCLSIPRALAMSEMDTYGYARALIERTIPKGSVVSGDGGVWTMLVEDYHFYDRGWGHAQIGRAQYVVSMGNGTGQVGVSFFDLGPEEERKKFQLVADGLVPAPQRLMGARLGNSRTGYGIRIYARAADSGGP